MTDLIINGTAVAHSSRGARRYFDGIMANLNWPGRTLVNRPAKSPLFVRANELLQRGRRDAVFWSPAHRGPICAHNHVVTVLDCINVKYTYKNDWRQKLVYQNLFLLLKNSSAIVTISQSTKESLLNIFELETDKIFVIPGPTDLNIANIINENNYTNNSEKDYILMITNSLPHKNTTSTIKAIALSNAKSFGVDVRVVGEISEEAREICRQYSMPVKEYYFVDDAILDSWIRKALFLISPSLDEGLNLPVADAVRVGTNVLCSDIPVHREFYDGSVMFFDPQNIMAICDAVNQALEKRCKWFPQVEKPEFSVAAVAAAYRELFEKML